MCFIQCSLLCLPKFHDFCFMSKSFLFLKCFFCLIFLFQHSLTHPSLRLEYLNMQITEKLAKNTCTCFRNIVSNTCPVCRDQISNKDEFWEFADIPDQKLFYRSLIEIAASGNSWDFLQCFSKTVKIPFNNEMYEILNLFRNSRWEVFCKKGFPKIFAKFTWKHLCQSLQFIKKETLAQVFSFEFWKIFQSTFFYRRPSVADSASW